MSSSGIRRQEQNLQRSFLWHDRTNGALLDRGEEEQSAGKGVVITKIGTDLG